MTGPTESMTAADEARAWIERLVRFADECNAQNGAEPVSEENCPPTHVSAAVRLKPLPDGRVSVYEPGVEVTPDRLRAFLAEHDEQRDRADEAEAEVARLIEEKAARFVDSTTMLRGMEVRGGIIEMDIEPARELLLTWCASVRAVLDDCQAENYAEIDVEVPRPGSVSMDIQDGQHLTDSYTLTLQRRSGKTPHQLRRQAERERDAFSAELARLDGMTSAELLAWRAER